MVEENSKILLKWNDYSDVFDPIKSEGDMGDGVFIELDEANQKWKYFYTSGASLISRRTALRSANGISKTGYVHPKDGLRYGIECELVQEKSQFADMPENLRKSQRSWYGGEYSRS